MKGNSTMKRFALFLCLLVVLSLSCDVSVNLAPSDEVPTAAETPVPVEPPTTTPEVFISLTQAIPGTPVQNSLFTFGRVTLEIPSSVASGASGQEYPRVDAQDGAEWQKTPGHLQVSLNDYYVLQGKFHQPQIYVYPSLDYATLVPGAFESMHRLRNVMSAVVPLTPDQLPTVPFFNAAQVFASNIQAASFQNGSGVRFMTEYAQYFAPVNNHELIYHFQGFTNDGEYYIIAILPITAPVLAETSDAGAIVPAGGIALPDINDPNADWQGYYASITDLLNVTSPEAFTPSLSQLDALIQSMWVAP
jgi:hypothetical protein